MIDDEPIVLKGFEMMIDWNKYGFELRAVCNDGLQALKLIEEIKPDVVFTDIRMPRLDGLQLIERITELNPQTICIVFSGFNEYEYIKKALKLGVVDYLEKPITIEKVEEAMEKINAILIQRIEVTALKKIEEENRQESLRKMLLNLMLNAPDDLDDWKHYYGDKKLKGLLVLALRSEFIYSKNEWEEDLEYVEINYNSVNFIVLMLFNGHDHLIWEKLFYIAESLRCTVGSGSIQDSISKLHNSYNESLIAIQHGEYFGKEGLIRYGDIPHNQQLPNKLSLQEKEIIEHFRRMDRELFFEKVNEYISLFDNRSINPELLKIELIEFVYVMNAELREKVGDYLDDLKNKILPYIDIPNINSKEKLKSWLFNFMQRAFLQAEKQTERNLHQGIKEVLSYLEQHYGDDLTLEQLSERIQMNPTYFSYLFKEELGESYIKYLTKLRMEKAKEMLLEGNKVTEVSERVGYHTPRHFSAVFKKYTGISPGKYKGK
ncbi:putative response regulator [Bacillus sp. TS-2]|nr:putative response regulator [Bacillus sp. TS-2]